MLKLRDIIGEIAPTRILTYAVLLLGVVLIPFVVVRFGVLYALTYALIPMVLFFVCIAVDNPKLTFYSIFVVTYYLMGLTRYIDQLQGGVVLDLLLIFLFIVLIMRSCFANVDWRNGANTLSALAFIWFTYCSFLFFILSASPEAWLRSIRGVASYFLLIAILVPIVLNRLKDVKRLFLILSVLTLTAVAKTLMQKYYGFDLYEKIWLYAGGGMSTHIIHSGVRYFSFFTDAGNFGAAMGFAFVLFGILGFHTNSSKLKIYYLFVSLMAAYAMVLSGTRGSFFIPIFGFSAYILLSRRTKVILLGIPVFVVLMFLLNFTTVGQSNQYIRRVRSSMDFNDASFVVRRENQKKLYEIMKTKPFGYGIGMGGGKAKIYAPDAPVSQIATDSWYVQLWVETGMVGVILYLLIQIYIIAYGCHLLLFKLRNEQLRGVVLAIVSGLIGFAVAAYGNEIWGQLPNILIITGCQAILFMSLKLDKKQIEAKSNE